MPLTNRIRTPHVDPPATNRLEVVNDVEAVMPMLLQRLGRDPDAEELARAANVGVDEARWAITIHYRADPIAAGPAN